MTKKEWKEMSIEDKYAYIYQSGIESTFSASKARARDRWMNKILSWEKGD